MIMSKTAGFYTVWVENLNVTESDSTPIGECPFPTTRSLSENTSGIDDNQIGELKVYPNPCNEKFFIQLPVEYTQNLTYKIYDISGRTIL